MKIHQYIFLILFTTITFQAFSGGSSDRGDLSVDGLDITAQGAIGRLEAAATGPLWTGNGSSNIRLAVLAPEVQGDVPGYLPIYIQGLLNNNFGKFSAINLIDRQNLNRIISEQNIAANGRFSDRDLVSIGNLTNAQFFLFGTIQKLSGNRFSLQLSVTEASSGVRKATFMKEGTLSQLEGRAVLINEATAELLTQLGVQLTEAGQRELLAGNISAVQAQAGLARGITAQAGGSEVEALFNFTQAITFDPSQMEALSRLNTLSTTISGGTISERIMNDIQARDRWIEAFKETTRFFNNHPPFEIIFDPNLIQIGETDFARRTATLGMRIALDPSKAGFDALNALLEGLEKTGRRSGWGFSGWPLMDISPRTAGTVVFGGKRTFSYKVDVALVNENGIRIGSGSINLNTEAIMFNSGDISITPPFDVHEIMRFPNIKTEDLTPTLTIVIVAVNGISSRNLASSGFMRVDIADLEKIRKERAQAFFEKGEINFIKGENHLAIADYTKAIRLYPNFVAAFNQRGVSYQNLGDAQRAINDFTQAIQLDPNFVEAFNNRGWSYQYLGDDQRTINDFTQAIQLEPNNASAFSNRGLLYLVLGDHQRAINDFTQAIQLEPNNASAFSNRGWSYQNLGDAQRAINDFTQAIQLEPNNASAFGSRGLSYQSLGDHQRAINNFTQAIQLEPNFASAFGSRGLSYQSLGDHQRAINDFTQAIQIAPNLASAFNNRGRLYQDLGDHQRAINDFTQAIQLEPNFASAFNNRGNSYQSLEDHQRAINDFTRSIRLNPNDASTFNNRGVSYWHLRDYQRARADFEAALQLEPNNTLYRENFNSVRNLR